MKAHVAKKEKKKSHSTMLMLNQHCERSDLCLHFELTKVDQKCQKKVHFDEFLKTRGDKPLPGKNQVV